MDSLNAKPAKFGRIDPFCWLLVAPLSLVAVGTMIAIDLVVGIVLACVAIAVLVFDSWVNRPDPRNRTTGRER